MTLYPVGLILKNMPCLVIGGGLNAERKIESLIKADAVITVISPEITDGIKAFEKAGKITFFKRVYQKGDLEGFFLVFAAINSSEAHSEIYEEASERKVFLNCVDVPDKCNFYVPSVIQKGNLQITFSTTGKVPFFARKMREYFEDKFNLDLEGDLEELHQLRKQIIYESAGDNILKDKKFEEIIGPKISKILNKIVKK